MCKGKFEVLYSADFAQEAYQNNRKRSVKKVSLTKGLKEKITHYIIHRYSPEIIVKTKGIKVPIATIYYWILHGKLSLLENLSRCDQRALISVSILETLILILLFSHELKMSVLLTLTDTKSRYQLIRLILDKSDSSVNQALKAILKECQINSIKADNGNEFSPLAEVFNPEHIYYAYPYASWKRGTNADTPLVA